MSKKWYKVIVLALMATIISAIVICSTPWGNKLLLRLLTDNYQNLTIELAPNSSILSPHIKQFSYRDDALTLSVQDVKLDWGWRCIWHSAICIEKASVKDFTISIDDKRQGKQSLVDKEPLTTINFPVNIDVNSLHIGNAAIETKEVVLKISELDASFTLSNDTIEDINADINTIDVVINTDKSPTQSASSVLDSISQWSHVPPVNIPVNFEVSIFNIGQFKSSNASDKNPLFEISNITASFNFDQNTLDVSSLGFHYLDAIIDTHGTVKNMPLFPHDVAINTKGTFTEPLANTSFTVRSTGTLDQWSLAVNASGDKTASINMSADFSNPALPFTFNGAWQSFGTFVSQRQLLVDSGKIEVFGNMSHFEFSLDSAVTLESAPKAALNIGGSGTQKSLLLSTGSLTVLGGTITPRGKISTSDFANTKLALLVDNISPSLFWPDSPSDISGSIDTEFTYVDGNWTLDLSDADLVGQWQQRPIKLTGALSGKNSALGEYGLWTVDALRLTNQGNSVAVDGTINNDVALDLQLNMPNINQSLADWYGSAMGKVTINGPLKSAEIVSNIEFKNVYSANKKLVIKQATLSLNSVLNDDFPVAVELKANSITVQGHKLSSADIKLSGNKHQHHLAVHSEGSPFALAFNLSGKQLDTGWQGILDGATITTPLDRWQLNTPLNIDVAQKERTIELANHCWNQRKSAASLCLTSPWILNAANKSSNQTNITLRDFSLAQLNKYIEQPITISGDLSTKIDFSLSLGNKLELVSHSSVAHGTTQLRFKDRLITHRFNTLTSQAIISPALSSLNLVAQSDDLGDIAVTVLTDIFSPSSPLTGHVELKNLHLAPYQTLIPHIARIDGDINASAGFTGTSAQPLFFGKASIADATIVTALIPTVVEKLNSQLTFNGQSATLDSGFELEKGIGEISGKFDWKNTPKAYLLLQGEQLGIVQNKDRKVTFSPDVAIDINQETMKIRGDIIIDDGFVKLRELPKTAISLSDDVRIKSKEKVKNTLFDLDLSVLVDDSFEVQAFGLRSNLSGKLNLSQQPTKPLNAYGDMTLVDATYKAMGQNLQIRKGQLIFTGVLKNPLLSIEAIRSPETTQDDVIAGLYVSGNVRQPELEIFSQPSMAQQDALSYLLRGRGLTSQSNDSTNDIAISMLLNSGIGQSNEFVGDIGDKVGIEQLSLNTTGSGKDMKLEVSGYIAPKLQLRYGIGVTDGSPEVGLRYQLSTKFFVEFVSNTAQALDLLYKFSFD